MTQSPTNRTFTKKIAMFGLGIIAITVVALTTSTAMAEPPSSPTEAKQDASAEQELVGKAGLAEWQNKNGSASTTWRVVGDVQLDAADPKTLGAKPGEGILLNGPGKAVNLFSKAAFGDISLHLEYCVPKDSNSGVYLQGRYEIQILDSHGTTELKYSDNGGVYEIGPRGKATGGKAPDVNASLPPGEWQTFDIDFQAPRFDEAGKKTANAKFVRVVHNGKVIHQNVEVAAPTRAAGFKDERPTGPLMIQGDHGPVAVRNVRVKPLAKPE